MKTLLHILLKLALATLGLAQPPTLPVEREITDAQGRQMAGTVLTINGGSIKFRRASDGKEFDIALDKLSVPDRMFLNIDPPDALESQRFPFRIHAPLRRHGIPGCGTTTIEPGEPVEMLAQDGKTVRILHAGQELEFQIPDAGGDATAKPPAKSRWTPAIPNMDTKKFLAAITNDKDGPDPEIFDLWKKADDKEFKHASIYKDEWYRSRMMPYAGESSRNMLFMGLTIQPPGEASLIQKIQPTRAGIFPAQLREDPVAAAGCLNLDYKFKTRNNPQVSLDAYMKSIEAAKAKIGWKTKVPLSLQELVNAYANLLSSPHPIPASFSALDSRRLAPIFPFTQHNEVILEEIKSDIGKQRSPVIISTIRWEGKTTNGKDFGKTHTTFAVGYKSDGTSKGTNLQCLDADGGIRDYPGEDIFAVWSIQYFQTDGIGSPRNPGAKKPEIAPNDLISRRKNDDSKSANLRVDQTAVVKCKSGATAVIQFTKMGAHETKKTIGETSISHSSYRWKFRAKPGDPIQSGNGELTHSTKMTERPQGGVSNILNPDNSPIIHAGDIQLIWIPTNTETWAYLVYAGARGTVEILPGNAFDDFGNP